MPNIIAIDGPAGAGKSTVARRIARELRYTYLDTGAMYRSVAWKARECGIDIEDAEALRTIAEQLDILFSPLDSDLKQTIRANGEDITQTIRTPEISTLTSRVAAVAPVRAVVVRKQRSIAATADRGVVLEGRDIGSVVFPNADLKLFLTAGPESVPAGALKSCSLVDCPPILILRSTKSSSATNAIASARNRL